MFDPIIYSIAIIALAIGTYTDIKTREVPDFVNYSLIAVGLSANVIFSLIKSDISYIINSIIGFIIFLLIALIMFYAGQWGGGDSKMLMGLGALIGLGVINSKNMFLIHFLLNLLIIGSFYGLLWSLSLALRHRKKFLHEYRKIFLKSKLKKLRLIVYMIFIISFTLNLFFTRDPVIKMLFFVLLFLLLIMYYLLIFIKILEKVCMLKYVEPNRLTEGDWIAKEIKYNGKYICGPKDLGIERKQINELIKLYNQKKIKRILIKEGIPFVPSFLMAFVITIMYGNLLLLFI